MDRRFNPPPNWPRPPEGWQPPDGWMPDPAWGPAPADWQYWVPAVAEPAKPPTVDVPRFGVRSKAKELGAEVERLRADMERLGVLPVAELERHRDQLQQRIEELQREVANRTGEVQRREQELAERLAKQERKHAERLAKQGREALERTEKSTRHAELEAQSLVARLEAMRQQVVVTEEIALLQEVGIYQYRHPLTDAVAYQAELARLQDQIKTMTRRDGGAVLATTSWTVNGSAAQGRSMVRDFSKLMLRAYNAEADNLVRGLKPYKLESAQDRLTKVASTIARLGKTMDIRIADPYHRLRLRELELTADYQEKVAEERAREREERERLREERQVQQEIERERARLNKERQHYLNALATMEANGDLEGAARVRDQIADLDGAIEDVDYRAANIRAGYVYVISNIGSFGDRMIKVGMTRRLEPLDRIRELSDASVPFNFDVHAIHFSHDAVGIEAAMHSRLADRRVNLVNRRREFFYASPDDAKHLLLELAGDLLRYEDLPEALEYHQSVTQRNTQRVEAG
jgi:hypothetical protein